MTETGGLRRSTLTAIVLALLSFGCNADAPGDDAARVRDSLNNGVVPAEPTEGPRPVAVTLREYEIGMPQTLAPGAYLFAVHNQGSEPHGIVIDGNGMQAMLPATVQPGETQQLPVDLAPGTYRIFCPVGGHDERGMSLDLVVTE